MYHLVGAYSAMKANIFCMGGTNGNEIPNAGSVMLYPLRCTCRTMKLTNEMMIKFLCALQANSVLSTV